MRKPAFGVCDQVRLNWPAEPETSWRLEMLDLERLGIILSGQQATKVLIRLRRCTG